VGRFRLSRRVVFLFTGACIWFLCCGRSAAEQEYGGPGAFRKPCVDNSILADLTSHFPVPVSVSPDGTQVLLRTVPESGNPFGISLVDRGSGRAVHTLTWPQPILRLEWRPDSSEISFFSRRGFEAGRDLYIWNLGQDHVRLVETPLTLAEPRVRWAPNGRLLAFSDARQGLVVVDTSGVDRPRILSRDVAEFDWLSDSSTIVLVETSELNRLEWVELSTGKLTSQTFPEHMKILDLAASPTQNSLLLVESIGSTLWRIESFSLGNLKRSVLLRSVVRIGSPLWLPNGRTFCFQRFEETSTKLEAVNPTSGHSVQLEVLGGLNDLRGTLPDSGTVVVAHQGSAPVALFGLSVDGKGSQLLYSSHSRTLPSVKALSTFAVAKDGVKVRLMVWRAPVQSSARAAVVRLRGGDAAVQLPVWEEHIQVFLKHGIDFVGFNDRGENATAQQRREDVLAAIQYAHQTLGVPYERIVILGHSSGAGLAAAACMERPEVCGLLVLVAFGRVQDDLMSLRRNAHHPQIMLFYPAYDSMPLSAVMRNLKVVFGEDFLKDGRTSVYQFPDDHNLMYPQSWAAVYTAMLGQFDLSDCAVEAGAGK
jgi:predicted esterase